MKQKIATLLLLLFFTGPSFPALAATKVTFPFTPISAASLPWWVAKESRYYEKHGLDVDMIYVGASPVIIQAMLGRRSSIGYKCAAGRRYRAGRDHCSLCDSISNRQIRYQNARRSGGKKNRHKQAGSDSALHVASHRQALQCARDKHRSNRHHDASHHQPFARLGRWDHHFGPFYLSADERRLS